MSKLNELKLKLDLDGGNFFVDHFYTIGIDHDSIFQDFLYNSDVNLINQNPRMKPSIISKFPYIKKGINVNDDTLIKHCYPNGFRAVELKTPITPQFFSITLENLIFSKTHPKIFISYLLFYESLETFYRLKERYDRNGHESYLGPVNYINTYSTIENDKLNLTYQSPFKKVSMNEDNRRLSSEVKYEDDNVSMYSKVSHIHNTTYSSLKYSNLKQPFKNIYLPKVICLVSLYPFQWEHAKILKTIYKLGNNKSGKIRKPLEKIIENLVLETPAPPRGVHQIEFHLLNEKYMLHQPEIKFLPLITIEIERIFNIFKTDQIIEIFKNILLEAKVIFFSTDLSLLSAIIEGFIALLYPLKFHYPNITIIPLHNLSLIQNYPSYVIGINSSYKEKFFEEYNIEIIDSCLFLVDIDNKKYQYYYSQNTKNNILTLKNINCENPSSSELSIQQIELPKYYKSKLSERVQSYLSELKGYTSKTGDRNTFIKIIREHFYYFLISIMMDYSKYLITEFENLNSLINSKIKNNIYTDSKEITIYDLFKVDDFLFHHVNTDKNFYKKLVETKMFYQHILKKLFPIDNKDKMEIIFFDESIINKHNKKTFVKSVYTPLLHETLYEVKKTYIVPKPKNFNNKEIEFLKINSDNIKKALRYGQEVTFENGEINFNYYIFPKLLYDEDFFEFYKYDEEKNVCTNTLTNFLNLITENHITLAPNYFDEVDKVTNELLSYPKLYQIYVNTGYRFGKIKLF